jgi:DNA-directed RNA polymerase III subunit RPC4
MGRGLSRGGGRTSGLPRDEAPMIASGPFAMGPAAASSGRRGPFVPNSYGRLAASEQSEPGLTGGSAPALPRNRDALAMEEDVEVYSDGEEVVDLGDVKFLDVMAPDVLKKERRKEKKKKIQVEDTKADVKGKGKATGTYI